MKSGACNLLTIVVAAMFCTSCSSSKKINNCGISRTDYMTHYYNSCLQFKIVFMGDFKLTTDLKTLKNGKALNSSDKHFYRKPIPLFASKGTVGGVFHNYGYAILQRDSAYYTLNGYSPVNGKGRNYYRKIDSTNQSSGNIQIDYVIPLEKKDFLIVVRANKAENENMPTPELLEFAQYEHEQHIEDMQIGTHISFKDVENPFDIASTAFFNTKKGNYLAPLAALQNMEALYKPDKYSMELYRQAMATYASFLNEDEMAEKYWRQHLNADSGNIFNRDVSFEPICDSAINAWSNRQVIMFNESHVNTRGRLGLAILLKKLFDNGFKYLALEALNVDDTSSSQSADIDLESGFYTREYNMANLIRTAKQTGFKLIGYEQNETQPGDREFIQAQNLSSKTIQQDSTVKLLVLAGWAHILKNRNQHGRKSMAQHFWQLTGIEPLCIDQTYYSPHTRNSYKTPAPGLSVISNVPKNDNYADVYLYNNLNAGSLVFLGRDSSHYQTISIPIPPLKEYRKEDLVFSMYLKHEYETIEIPVPCYIKKITSEMELKVRMAPGDYVWYIGTARNNDVYHSTLTIGK